MADTGVTPAVEPGGNRTGLILRAEVLPKRSHSIKNYLLRTGSQQLANPDVAIAHGMAVVLKQERQLVWMRGVRRALVVVSRSQECLVVLHEDAVVQDGHACRRQQL